MIKLLQTTIQQFHENEKLMLRIQSTNNKTNALGALAITMLNMILLIVGYIMNMDLISVLILCNFIIYIGIYLYITKYNDKKIKQELFNNQEKLLNLIKDNI